MDDRSYCYARDSLIFLTKEDARGYFYEEQVFYEIEDEFDFSYFLNERYSIIEVFRMTEEEKERFLGEYRERLFEDWLEEELIPCYIYE